MRAEHLRVCEGSTEIVSDAWPMDQVFPGP